MKIGTSENKTNNMTTYTYAMNECVEIARMQKRHSDRVDSFGENVA